MLLLGLLLVGVTAAFTGLVVADNNSGSPDYTVSMLGHHIATMNTLAAFLAGVALSLVFCLGLAMMTGGSRRAMRRKSDLRSARQDARDAVAERDILASRVSDDPGPMEVEDPVVPMDGETREMDTTRPRRRQGRHLFGH